MFQNKTKELLKQGKPAIGTFVTCNTPDFVEIIGLSGFDFVVIDAEHGPLSIESTANLIRAAEVRGLTPITRVTNPMDSTILRSMDVGAHGIQVPQVNNVTTAKEIVMAAKYFPIGNRGLAMPRSSDYGTLTPSEYFKQSNEETLIVLHCENKEGLAHLEEIAQIPEVDVIFLGPFDMSQSMGVPGEVNHPLVKEAAEQVIKVCKAHNKAAGIFVADGDQAKLKIQEGFQYITIGLDITLFSKICKTEIHKLK